MKQQAKFKVGDFVKVKKICNDTRLADFSESMNQFKGKSFKVSTVLNDNAFGVSYELEDYLKYTATRSVCLFEFDEEWLKKDKSPQTAPDPILSTLSTQNVAAQSKPQQFAMIKSGAGLTIILDGQTYTVKPDHSKYSEITEAINAKEYFKLPDLINTAKVIEKFGKGKLEVSGGVVKYNGKQLHGCIVQSILGLVKDGFSVEPISNFLDNLEKNPSHRAINELYGFLEYGKLPITDDGCFLTYKKVRKDFKDIHSGTFDNSIGKVCEMPRGMVDDNPNNTCSSGLHVCSYEYTKSFGDASSRLILCKVNPADVVSIPVDYNNTKMRCCKYTVVAEVTDKSDVLKGKTLYQG